MDPRLVAFIGVSALLAITPGPDMAIVTKNALKLGRRGAFLTTLGIATALLIRTMSAAQGLSVLMRTASTVFTVVKLCGAVYLLYLGVQALWSSFQHRGTNLDIPVATMPADNCVVDPGAALLPHMLLLGIIFDIIGLTWLNCYSLFVSRMSDLFGSPAVRRGMERITGTVLVGLGVRLALERI